MAAQSKYPSPQASSAFVVTASDTLNIKDDPNNAEDVEHVFLHNPATGGTVRVMPAGQKGAIGFTLTGTSGTANVTVTGTNYLATFNSTLTQTATDFVNTHAAALKARGITVTSKGAKIKFVNVQKSNLAIANVSGNLSGTALAAVEQTIYIAQGDVFPLAVSRVYATTPTPPVGLIGLYGGSA